MMGSNQSMIVYVNGRFLTQRRSGMQRYAEEVLTALDARLSANNDGLRVVVLTPREGVLRRPSWNVVEIRPVGRLRGHAWEQIDLWWASRDGLLLNLLSTGPLLHPRHISTFHDAAVFEHPEFFSRGYRSAHRALRPMLGRRSQRVLTVSQFSKQSIVKLLGLDAERIHIVPNGCDHLLREPLQPDVLARSGLEPGRYVLCVGNDTPNKNLIAAARAFDRLGREGFKLALVGASDPRIFAAASATNSTSVVRLTGVDDAGLRTLYEHAALFAFPSRYEGFGIPPLEAMALGCPVVASRAAAVVEVTGGAAMIVDPDDTDAFAAAMAQILNDAALRERLVTAGYQRAADFTWAGAAEKLQATLSEIPVVALPSERATHRLEAHPV